MFFMLHTYAAGFILEPLQTDRKLRRNPLSFATSKSFFELNVQFPAVLEGKPCSGVCVPRAWGPRGQLQQIPAMGGPSPAAAPSRACLISDHRRDLCSKVI